MAYILFNDGRRELHTDPLAVEKLTQIWYVWAGLRLAHNPVLDAYCKRIKKISLNWYEAPEEYVRENLQRILPQVLNEWSVDSHGHPLRPTSNRSWTFAKKYGLWRAGKPTAVIAGIEAGRQIQLV